MQRHRIGIQREPPALVLFYSRDGGTLRKRVMPVRDIETSGAEEIARRLVHAHAEYLSERDVQFEQVRELCFKLIASMKDSALETAARPRPLPPTSSDFPQSLDRGLLRQFADDLSSPSSSSPQSPGSAGGPPAAAALSTQKPAVLQAAQASRVGPAPKELEPRAPRAKGGENAGQRQLHVESVVAAAKGGKEKKGGKKKKAKKAAAGGGGGFGGPSINSLLGISSDDEAVAPPRRGAAPAARAVGGAQKTASLTSLKDMPPLF